jgi:hypothetical protein
LGLEVEIQFFFFSGVQNAALIYLHNPTRGGRPRASSKEIGPGKGWHWERGDFGGVLTGDQEERVGTKSATDKSEY